MTNVVCAWGHVAISAALKKKQTKTACRHQKSAVISLYHIKGHAIGIGSGMPESLQKHVAICVHQTYRTTSIFAGFTNDTQRQGENITFYVLHSLLANAYMQCYFRSSFY